MGGRAEPEQGYSYLVEDYKTLVEESLELVALRHNHMAVVLVVRSGLGEVVPLTAREGLHSLFSLL